ncbi:isoleucine--tRNA ligase [Paraliomyxa miuraensis]|uniref:isoleucine--tRNA ligase n=1 Tax=Paraliomyxa miuraensis TaxID=376150 RepID=UPI00224CE909|nr:isoleucine--tRNA ligase [Paraliomyxa miuraensis]MCX4240414.1 isoleucine--tRNA ligase [Paraliomyxa miuraensis]
MTSSEPLSTLQAPPAQFDLPGLEEGILQLWAERDVEGRSLREGAAAARGRSDRPSFAFNDGPPFATGLPHYGHLLPGTIKDIVPRYQAMCGFAVERRFGWDCHGLPIESLVESDLGVHGQAEIEAYGIDRFNAACRAGVLRFTKEWETMVRRTGRWVDFENDYKTMDPSFMETVWWVFRRLWDEGLIYEGFRVQPVSPALGTPLSNFEVAQGPQEKDPVTRKEGHKRIADPSLTARFRLEDEDASLWAWTTTPWTLPSNLALAVHPDVTYVKVRLVDTGEIAYLEPGRLADYQARGRVGATEELARMPGRELVGRPYAPLLPFFERYREREDGSRWSFKVVAAEYVTVDSGTGIVHQAPAFGEDDYQVGQREGLPMVRPMGLTGVFDDSVGGFAGMFAKDADKAIVARLKAEGKVVDHDSIVHPYPHCYRTDSPLLYMALSTWFMKVEPLRERLVRHNEAIHWVPEHVGTGRFGNWLAAARDWNLARSRFWGTPLPIWRCDEDPSDMVCVGSIARLEQLAGMEPGSITDLHRENIDPITFPSAKTPGGTMRRVPEVFDCWFESGSMPYAQSHYPFDQSKRQYVEEHLPADFIAEGLDQTRGWFYTLHVLATALFDRPAFEHVIVNGLVLAEDGKKMSKRLKNYPDPADVIRQYGADALRAYLVNSAAVRAEPMRFSERGVRDTVRKIVLPLWNAYNFLATYARADGWSPSSQTLGHRPSAALDRWILSRLQAFVGQMRTELDAYALSNLVPSFYEICDDLNNWYIRRGRRRYWRGKGEGDASDKDDAYATLFQVLSTITHAIAPVIPFFAEWMYQRLHVDTGLAGEGEDSVHLMRYPQVDAGRRDEALERDVSAVRQVVNLGMAIREREKLAVRRPLATITVASPDPEVRRAVETGREDLLGELNVKELRVQEDDRGLVELSAKANFKTLGKRLGKKMKAVAAAVAAMDAAALTAYLKAGSVELEGETLGEGDVLVVRETIGEQAAEAAEGVTVVLDTAQSDALRREGLAREIVNRVQNLRKNKGLEVSDRIELRLTCHGELAAVAGDPELAEMIKGETLATALTVVGDPAGVIDAGLVDEDERFEIDGETLRVAVAKDA